MGLWGVGLPNLSNSGPSAPTLPSDGLPTIPLTLPDGSVLNYHGDPSQIPDIYDSRTGLPVPIAPARPGLGGTGYQLPALPGSLNTDPGSLDYNTPAGPGNPSVGGGFTIDIPALDTLTTNLKGIFSRSAGDYVSIVLGIVFLGAALLMLSETARGAAGEFTRAATEGAAVAA